MARHERHQTNILNWQYNSKQYVQPHTPPLANSWLSSFISHSSSHTKQQKKKTTCFRLPTKLSCKITSFSHYFSATSAPQPISWDQNKGDAYAGFTCPNFSFYWNIFWGWRKHSFLSFFFPIENVLSCPTLCSITGHLTLWQPNSVEYSHQRTISF